MRDQPVSPSRYTIHAVDPRDGCPIAFNGTSGELLRLDARRATALASGSLQALRPGERLDLERRGFLVRDPQRERALLGTLDGAGNPVPMGWADTITENPALNSTEIWEIHNFTEDAHPIHIHEVQFQVVDRQPFEDDDARPPEAWETGFKDTVIAYPEEITRVKALFDHPGHYVWHCHIVEHEDNEMMRPYFIGPSP